MTKHPFEEAVEKLERYRRDLVSHPPLVFRHRKGGVYYAMNVFLNEADLTPMVLYRPEGSPLVMWARPCEEFLDGRFQLIE